MVRLIGASRALSRRAREDEGFTITESLVAFALLAVTILGLLGTLSTGIRGVLVGRQRTAAEAVAKEHVERIRAAAYDRIGHDIDGDPTLNATADPSLSGSPPEYTPFDEPLADGGAAPVVDVHQFGWTLSTPQRQAQYKLDGTPYDVRIYVTHVDTDGQAFKRVTVVVSTSPASGRPDEVRLSTYVYDADGGNGPMSGSGDSAVIDADAAAKAGSINVAATLAPPAGDTTELSLALGYPDATASVATRANVSQKTGAGSTAWLHAEDSSGSVTGPPSCTVAATTVDCEKDTATTTVDDDPSLRAPDPAYAADTVTGKQGPVGAAGVWTVDWAGGDGASTSSACFAAGGACGSAFGTGVPDGLPYGEHRGSGPDTASVPFEVALPGPVVLPLAGTLVDVGGTAHARTKVDQSSTGGTNTAARKTEAHAEAEFAPVDILTLTGAAAAGADLTLVSISAGAVEATAEVGPTAQPPEVDGDAMTISVAGVPLPIQITPGTPASTTHDVEIPVAVAGVAAYTVRATVHVNAEDADTSSSGTSPVEHAEALLRDWLQVSVDAEIVDGTGQTLLATVVSVDYGELTATGTHAV